jgi:hypothetical protein
MYVGVVADFKDLLMKYDSQMNALDVTGEDMDGTPRFLSFVEPTDKSRVLRRFATAMGVRQQITVSIAEHDPDLAFSFYYDSLSAITNAEFRKQSETRDRYFEMNLLSMLADKDPAKAAKHGARSLESGVESQHLDLLRKIYEKDPEKAAEFADAILSRFKSQKVENWKVYILSSFLEFGGEKLEESRKPRGKRPVYSQAELRELAELLAQAILNSDGSDPSGLGHVDVIEKYLPGRAAQIRAKYKDYPAARPDAAYNAAVNAMRTARSYANTSSNSYSNSDAEILSSNSNTGISESERAEKKVYEDLASMESKKLPKEEREKIVARARQIVMQQAGREGKELAAEIMRDAEKLVNPSPKNYQDFMLTWMLASGYANTDPGKAFPLLEETIGRANDTLAAFVKVGEFIDVAEEMIVDGEVQVGAFGGNMVRGLTKELTMADMTINVLAKADFGKTKNLTNRFDRLEIRILAKMMVLRAVLNPKEMPKPELKPDDIPELIDGDATEK